MLFTEEFVIYALLGVNLLLILWVISIERRTRDIKVLKDKESLLKKFQNIEKRFNDCWDFEKQAKENFTVIEEKLKENIQNIEVIRFNPFKHEGMGGDQSFAFTLLNKKGDGVIVSSLYSREKVSVFTKPIINWQSKYELSGEETEVLSRAKKSSE